MTSAEQTTKAFDVETGAINLKITATKHDEFKPYVDCNSCSKNPSMWK